MCAHSCKMQGADIFLDSGLPSFYLYTQLFTAHRLVKSDLAELFAFRTYRVSDFGRTLKSWRSNSKNVSKTAQKPLHSGSEVRISIAHRIYLRKSVQTYAKTPFISLKIVKNR